MLDAAALAGLIGAYSSDPCQPIAIAVSGGSDSTALMYLLADWADQNPRKLHILSVDHRLRDEAQGEAATVGKRAAELGLSHDILVWDRPRPGQAAARDGRHRLLAQAARAAGAKVLLLGHTLDDVIETVLMRKRHSAPRDRLAGPSLTAPSPVWPQGRGVTLIRPLLHLRRAGLRTWLQRRGIDWVDDPSNAQTVYERVRVRQFLARHPALAEIMLPITLGLMARRQSGDAALGKALSDVSVDASGLMSCELESLDTALAQRVLAVVIRIAGGHDRPPRREAVADLLNAAIRVGERRTLAGAWLQKTRSGFLIGRDPGEAGGLGVDGLWDRRYQHVDTPTLPDEMPFLLRASQPPDARWTPIMAERITHEVGAYQTPRARPVQR